MVGRRGGQSDLVEFLGGLPQVVETLRPDEQGPFIAGLLPWALRLLEATPVRMLEHTAEHRVRHGLLSTLKLVSPIAEPMRPFLEALMQVLLGVLQEDNEENAILVIHVLIDLHKAHRGALEAFAQPLVDYVLAAFEAFPETCQTVFDVARKEEKGGMGSRRSTRADNQPGQLLKATTSFKVLIECPVMVVLLFQIHRKLISDNISRFTPLVITALGVAVDGPPASTASQSVELDQLHATGPVHQAYADYISAQVKTLSFLAYVSRGFAAIIRPHHAVIPTNVMRLLRACPPDSASARKELLVATRHILSTDIRQAFVPFLDELLSESLLLGEGYTSYHVLRPLALSMLADLVHHVRTDIKIGVLTKIIHIYSQALHDPSLPVGVQTMSAKLLVNLVDSMLVEELGQPKDRRAGLLRILFALTIKFEWAAGIVGELQGKRPAEIRTFNQFYDDPLGSRPLETDPIVMDPNRDNFRDFKFLLKTLIGGLKNVLFALKTFPPPHQSEAGEPCVFAVEEGKSMLELFRNGILAFAIFRLADELPPAAEPALGRPGSPVLLPDAMLNVVSVQPEEKEIYEQFAYLFTILDGYLFQEVFASHLAFLVQSMATNHSLLVIPQYFLAISGISRNFAGLLIQHLMDHFDGLVGPDGTVGAISLRLFKLLFLAVSVYPDENESVLQPHLTEIILNCLKRHQHTSRPLNYFLLLRSLFRSIGGGRFDALYKEVFPLLPIILEELGKLPMTTTDPLLRELYVELCLTTPVRLSVLLPYLSHLMKPLVLALQSSTELISQGLRTLELCIDNLTQDFLEPIVYPVLEDLLQCLWSLLRPPPASQQHSHAAMRILGKMGGRCHRYLSRPRPLPYADNVGDAQAFQLAVSFEDGHRVDLPLDRVLLSATAVLDINAATTAEQRGRAFALITASIRSLFSSPAPAAPAGPVALPFTSQLGSNPMVAAQMSQEVAQRLRGAQPRRSRLSRAFCQRIVTSLFWASAHDDLAAEASAFLLDLYTVLAASLAKGGVPCDLLPPADLFFDVIIDVACARPAGYAVISELVRRIELVNGQCGGEDAAVLSVFMEKLITACYRVAAADKIKVIRLVAEICQLDLALPWAWNYEVRMTRGFLYAIKCLPLGLVGLHGQECKETLIKFLKLCNRQDAGEPEDTRARRDQTFNQLVTLLVSEISNANTLVREAVQGCFQLLADATGAEVTELLLPLKERLLAPIFTKPLRALPANLQIGYIDAITYCLSLRPPLLDVNDELLRLLNEAIALSEADDSFLATKTNQIQNSASILQLRLVCIRLLSMALSTSEFQMAKLQAIRNLIVAVFFKSLYSRSPEVVDASRHALEQVMVHQHKLPKDLLQTALRPVLTNLAEAKRLTLPGLEGLRRVLELLTSYFKAEIGRKLLDHLAAWSDPKKPLQDAAARPLCESLEVRVITSILDIFHLLPSAGNVFVADLVLVVVGLERMILRTASSPFRPPLQRLLAHYPQESADFLLSHLGDEVVVEVFAHVVGMCGSEPIVEALVPHIEALKGSLVAGSTAPALRLSLIRVLDRMVVSERLPAPDGHALVGFLWNLAFRRPTVDVDSLREAREVCRILAAYLEAHPTDLELAFMAITVFEYSHLAYIANLPGLLRGAVEHCVGTGDARLLQHLLALWCQYHGQRDRLAISKISAIRMVLLPLLTLLGRDAALAAAVLPAALQRQLVEALGPGNARGSLHDASMLAVEEIQALCLVLALGPAFHSEAVYGALLSKARLSDPSVKFAAFCGVIRYLQATADGAAILQLLPSLLKMPTTESKPVVRQALELLLRSVQGHGELVGPVAETLEAALGRDSTVLIAVVWQCLVALDGAAGVLSAALFPALWHSFIRSAHPVFLLPESRLLPFRLLELLVRCREAQDAAIDANAYDTISGICMKLLLNIAIADSTDTTSLATAIAVFTRFTAAFWQPAWGQLPLPLGGMERIFASEGEEHVVNQKHALKLAKAVLEQRQPLDAVADFGVLGPLLLPLLNHTSTALFAELTALLDFLFRVVGTVQDFPPAFIGFMDRLQTFAYESLLCSRNIPMSLLLVGKAAALRADDKMQAALVKLLPKVSRELLAKQEAAAPDLDFQVERQVIPVITLLLGMAGDAAKNALLTCIQLLWERALDRQLLGFLLDLFVAWFSDTGAPKPFSHKELASILLTPSRIDQVKDEALLARYLDLVLVIYTNPALTGSELTNRLEGSFLQGLAMPSQRHRFVDILNSSVSPQAALRMQYLLGGIRWNLCGVFDWIPTILHLMLLSVKDAHMARPPFTAPPSTPTGALVPDAHGRLVGSEMAAAVLEYLRHFVYLDPAMSLGLWLTLFPGLWASLSDGERAVLSKAIGKLLAAQELMFSLTKANPVYAVLAAASLCAQPRPAISPQLLHFAAVNHKTWYSSLLLLESDAAASPEATETACALYRDLSESDMLYGLLKRHCTLPESSSSLSFAQTHKWLQAQSIAELAQDAARNGTLPFNQHELGAWEDVWIESAKKLQQWDLVTEVAKVDQDADLNLECIWRLGDWMDRQTIGIAEDLLKRHSSPEKPRAKFLESFLLLNSIREHGPDRFVGKFQGAMEEAIQGALQAWNLMPDFASRSHVGLLHHFQMFVELQESLTVYSGIAGGPANPASLVNRPQFLTDLKGLLSTWRERLPNRMDDMNIWSDLLAWRQHIFSALNGAFQSTPADPQAAPGSQQHPFAYRGYHELAWLINKFSRVCRKNGMPETCLSFLNRIYTLPNIEIQDAFSKLKEQAMCYLDSPADLPTALEVINATNLGYFSNIQKAEFFALKGNILAKLGMVDEANRVFAQAVQIDLNIGMGWAYWGQFNDQRFQHTHDITLAVSAINCYLQAATLFKINKARRFGARILWLLTFEDAVGSMAKSFELYNNDLPTWFWIVFIPQLLAGLSRKEARHVRFLLIKIAKSFPQALYLPLRTAADEFRIQFGSQRTVSQGVVASSGEDQPAEGAEPNGEAPVAMPPAAEQKRNPVEYSDDLLAILKTGYPLLSLSMENMVEHIVQRLRSTADEDLYRVIVTLLSEAFQVPRTAP